MIELPESHVLARQIKEALSGKTISVVQANHTPHGFAWYTGDPADYRQKLIGKTICDAAVINANLRITASDMVLVLSTPVRYFAPRDKKPQKHQLYLEFEDGSAMVCTVQMWGCMFCFREGDEGGIPPQYILKFQPSPLEDGFDWRMFESLLAEDTVPALSAKAFLATGQRIPGLGNGVLQDILWHARIHPRRKMGTLSAAERRVLFDAVKDVMADMEAKGGRDTERDLFGNPGGYQTVLSKKTVGKPCPVCSSPILKENYLGGSIYYCAGCQKTD
jgi:formamidopyrimidine-DNA glycosylase